MHIYYSNDGERIGPKKLEDLKPHELLPDTLVWHKGMKEWADASTVPELAAYFEAQPKRTTKDENTIPLSPEEREMNRFKHNLNRIGLSFVFAQLIYMFRFLMSQDLGRLVIILGLIVVIRIVSVVMINKATNRLKQPSGNWMLFGVFLPGIALIRLSSSDFLSNAKSSSTDLLDDHNDF